MKAFNIVLVFLLILGSCGSGSSSCGLCHGRRLMYEDRGGLGAVPKELLGTSAANAALRSGDYLQKFPTSRGGTVSWCMDCDGSGVIR